MTLRQLEAFRAVMMMGTTSQAADALGLTQPAISRLIGNLETAVGFCLFRRMAGRLRPTPAAQLFFQAIKEDLPGLARLPDRIDVIRQSIPEFSIACLPDMTTSLLPAVLAEFSITHPSVLIRIDAVSTQDALHRLQAYKAAVAFCTSHAPTDGIVLEPLLQASAFCVMPLTHPLAKRDVICVKELRNERIVGPLPPMLSQYECDAKQSFQHTPTITSDCVHIRSAMVAAGLGIAVVDTFAARRLGDEGNVAVRPFDESIVYDYVLALPDSDRAPSLLGAFRQSVTRALRPHSKSGGLRYAGAPLASEWATQNES